MQFLIDEDLPYTVRDLFLNHGHEAIDVRDINLRGCKDWQIAAFAQSKGLCIITGDFDFSDIRNYPPGKYAGIVVLKLQNFATAKQINNLLESFLSQNKLVNRICGKLAVVEPGRIRIRI